MDFNLYFLFYLYYHRLCAIVASFSDRSLQSVLAIAKDSYYTDFFVRKNLILGVTIVDKLSFVKASYYSQDLVYIIAIGFITFTIIDFYH